VSQKSSATVLTGLHDLEDNDEATSFPNLEEPDPDSPSSWRDWTQPELLPDKVCAELDESNDV
jgi:ATP-dependent helicase/nuclease subunit A